MPLQKPQSAVIFNNVIYKQGGSITFKVKQSGPDSDYVNVPMLLSDSVYLLTSAQELLGSIVLENYKLVNLNEIEAQVLTTQAGGKLQKVFPQKFSISNNIVKEDNTADNYYNNSFSLLIPDTAKIPEDLNIAPDKGNQLLKYQNAVADDITAKSDKDIELYTLLKTSTAVDLGFGNILLVPSNTFLPIPNKPDFYRLTINPKVFAAMDYLYNTKSKDFKLFGRKFISAAELAASKMPGAPKTPLPFESFYPIKSVSGINSFSPASFLSLLLKPASNIFFDFYNFELNSNNQKPSLNIVAPQTFFKTFYETKNEPRVPDEANENDVFSFYYQSLGHPNKFDEKTFIYQGEPFANFETEVLAASTLIEKSNQYVEFVKPYSSLEFYANFKSNNSSNKVNEISSLGVKKYGYLKKYIDNQKSIPTNLQAVLFNQGENFVDLYANAGTNLNFSDGDNLPNVSYDDKFPAGKWTGSTVDSKSRIKDFEKIKAGTLSPFEVLGYIITKSTQKKGTANYDDSIIKRIYVMNDQPGFAGYLKYFDSQIKEKKTYYYNIEQINFVYGTKLVYSSPKQLPDPNQKELFSQDVFDLNSKYGKNYGEIYNLPSVPNNLVSSDENEILPIYNNKQISVDVKIDYSKYDIVVHTPVASPDKLNSPDLKLETETVITKPAPPDIQIYTQKGVTNKALVLVNTIVGAEASTAGTDIQEQKNVIKLGDFATTFAIPLKEYRIYRTSTKPDNYESFGKKPHKILGTRYSNFTDDVLPNVDYYYYGVAVGSDGVMSDPTKVLKLRIVNEQSHVFGLLEVYFFKQDEEKIKEKLFRKILNVSPTFLQSALKPEIFIPGFYVKEDFDGTSKSYRNRLFQDSEVVFKDNDPAGQPYLPSHKLRITSKKTRRRFDLNVIFSYRKMKQDEPVPEDAELVFEYEPTPIQMIGPGLTKEEEEFLEEFEKTQTFEKPVATPEQLSGDAIRYCKPGIESGQPGGCSKGYKCKDTGLKTGTCERILKRNVPFAIGDSDTQEDEGNIEVGEDQTDLSSKDKNVQELIIDIEGKFY